MNKIEQSIQVLKFRSRGKQKSTRFLKNDCVVLLRFIEINSREMLLSVHRDAANSGT